MKEFWSHFSENRGAVISLAVVITALLIAVLAPALAPYDPIQVFDTSLKLPPAWTEIGTRQYLFGTDDLGRDLFSRLVFGARVSLGIGFFSVILTLIVGVFLGVLAGSLGGWVDAVIMRLTDIFLALPSILLAIVVIAILGPGLSNTVLAVSVIAIPNMIRIVRATVLVEKNKTYIQASKSFGASWFRIYFINVLPNCFAPILVQATFGLSDAILNSAALGFLGLGVQPPIPEWGTMLSDARSFIESASWLVTLPGLCILTVVVAFNILGDGLRDTFDPKIKKT